MGVGLASLMIYANHRVSANENLMHVCILFFLLTFLNLIMFLGDNWLVSYFVGELIIFFYCIDLLTSRFKFHIYQILLFYFYYSLCITHSFSGFSQESPYYFYAYLINFFHFIFFVIGYNFCKYDNRRSIYRPRQNKLVLIYMIATIFTSLLAIKFFGEGIGYSDRFTISQEMARTRLNIVDYITNTIFEYVRDLVIFSLSNPLIYAFYRLLTGFFGYVSSGVKASVLAPILMTVMIYQIFYRDITVKQLFILIPIALFLLVFLIGTTAFRGDLSLNGLFNLNFSVMKSFLVYFLQSPESSHIIYTANILEMLDSNDISLRYGFDYYRFLVYPFKNNFENFGFSSFVEYPSLMAGEPVNQGQYLGMGGELYWNFGVLFIFISFFMGFILKKFTNKAFSSSLLGTASYLILFKSVLWIYYRGIGNELMITSLLFLISLMIFYVLLRLYRLKNNHYFFSSVSQDRETK